jgi:hypothetical protein
MIHLLGRDPDHIICHVLQAQVRIPAAEIAIQKILSKIYRSLHTDIIANNILFGIKKCVKIEPSPPKAKTRTVFPQKLGLLPIDGCPV